MVAISQIISFPQRLFGRHEHVVDQPATQRAVAGSQAVEQAIPDADITVEIFADAAPAALIRVEGVLDRSSYATFLTQLVKARHPDTRNIVIDLSRVTRVELSGHYALHAFAAIVRGRTPPEPDLGSRGLRRLIESNLDAGRIEHVAVIGSGDLMASLNKSHLDQIFSLHTDTEGLSAS